MKDRIKHTVMVLYIAVLCIIIFASCEAIITRVTYPHIEYRASEFNFDVKNKTILLRDGYCMDDGHSYDTIDTDEGYDLVIHFVKE